MPSRLLDGVMGCLLCGFGGPLAFGADNLIGEIYSTRYPGDAFAYGGSLAFQHATALGGAVVGVSGLQLPSGLVVAGTTAPVGSLVVGDIDAYRIETAHLTFTGGASFGSASSGSTSNDLYKARVAVDSKIDTAWSVRLADQYIDFNVIHGHVLSSAVEYRPAPLWAVAVSGGYAISGTAADRYGQLAVNWYGSEHLFAGVIAGRTGYDPATLGETSVVRRLSQVYVGAGIPVPLGTLTFGADTLNLAGVSRETLRVGFIRPILP